MKGRILLGTLVAGAFAGLASCGGGSVPVIDCSTVKSVPTFTELSAAGGVFAKCTNCHSSMRKGDADTGGRHEATVGIDYDTFALATTNASEGQDDVAGAGDNLMPPDDQTVDGGKAAPTLSEAEKTQFYQWVQCGTPE